jgi:hypothetical protein
MEVDAALPLKNGIKNPLSYYAVLKGTKAYEG